MSIAFPTLPARAAAGCLASLVLAAIGLTPITARAANDFSIGIGAGAARGRVDCVASFPCDRSGTAASVSTAWRFGDGFDVRAQYFGAGSFKGGDTLISADGSSVSTVGQSGQVRKFTIDSTGTIYYEDPAGLWMLAPAGAITLLIPHSNGNVLGTSPKITFINAIELLGPKQIVLVSGTQLLVATLP